MKLLGPTLVFGLLAVASGMVPVSAGTALQTPPVATATPPPANAITTAFTALMDGKYLAAIEGLKAQVAAGNASAVSPLEQVEPFVTGYPALPTLSMDNPPLLAGTLAQLSRAKPTDAIAAIVSRARKTRIVILNEAHDEPRHRAFGLEVARALRPLGYSILAAQALPNNADTRAAAAAMATLVADGYPRRGTGFYIMDPVFADFIRQALALGYRPVAYEETSRKAPKSRLEGIIAREQEQADNLARHIAEAGPDAKILIYVGYSHAAEEAVSFGEDSGNEWMAARLKRITGIDPLTVNQTHLREVSASPPFRAAYDLIAPRLGRRSGVMMLRGAPLRIGPDSHAFDLQVVHPRRRLIAGRPDWLAGMGRRSKPVPAALRPKTGRHLVQAFLARETVLPIPIDQVVVERASLSPASCCPVPPFATPRSVKAVWLWRSSPPPAPAPDRNKRGKP